jgi:hypothetical protein
MMNATAAINAYKNISTVLDQVARLLTGLTEAGDSIRPNSLQSEPQPKASVNTQRA